MNLSSSESGLIREITRLQQEMISLKTPQRYLTGQTKGFESNRVRATSWLETIGDYQRRLLRVELTAKGDHNDKTLVPTLRIQAYNSNGTPTKYSSGMFSSGITLYMQSEWGTNNPNEHKFLVELYLVDNLDAFYADFWVVANDSSVLQVTATRT